MKYFTILSAILMALSGCAGKTVNAVPVSGFQPERFLGRWYEVARLDHPFERGLSNVTAQYRQNSNGPITVLNRGYSEKKGVFKTAEGRAKFASAKTTGQLKVSFFGPFYGDYIVFGLDRSKYNYAYISGGKDNYLWLLSRTPSVPSAVYEDFIEKSKALGYDTDGLIWVNHNRLE